MPVPVYGDGEGGWRDRLVAEVNLLAAEGPGHCEGGLFTWLLVVGAGQGVCSRWGDRVGPCARRVRGAGVSA